MDEGSENSIYYLLTSLCEKFAVDQSAVRKLRSRVYEILLKKRTNNDSDKSFKTRKGLDPYCNLLAWQFTLATKYGLVEHGTELKECGQYVREHFGDAIIQFLLCLHNVPYDHDDSMDLELPLSCKNLYKNSALRVKSDCSTNVFMNSDESHSSGDLWDIVSKKSYSYRKNWEDFGHPEPDKEKPFLSELGEKSHLWVENLPSVYFSCTFQSPIPVRPQVKTVSEFVKDVKYLLVGMASYSFSYNECGDFFLVPNITVKGLTPSILKTYSDEFIFCGTCYKALHEIATPSPYSGEYKQDGYIFAELCQSIQRYLEFYRTVVIGIPDSMGLLKLYERTNQLRSHLTTLTEICKLGPYSKSERMPHGVSLLNYLYQTALNLTDKNVLLVLYAILFPCCQVYFSRFLQQWLLEGSVNDPYEEFFIKSNFKYVSTRGRTYWTRSYFIREDVVPDFLLDLIMDILNCGKTMNLLKLCMPSSKLCSYLMGKKPLIISCCLTSEQLSLLEQNATSYYLEVLSECGSRMKLEQIVRASKEQDPFFMNLIAKKRAMTLRRLELERKKVLEEEKEKKLDEITVLKEQYDSALQLKQSRIASEIETEIKQIEFNISIENVRDKLIEKEAKEMIDYYNKLYEISDQRRKKIETHIQKLKTYCLDQSIPVEINSSEESFYSVDDVVKEEENDEKFIDSLPECEQEGALVSEPQSELKPMHSSQSLDIINANNEKSEDNTIKAVMETFAMARKIKEKVLSEEMGIILAAPVHKKQVSSIFDNEKLTDAQRNKLRVLSSEFGIEIKPPQIKKSLTQCEINRNVVLGSSDCFYPFKLDNVNYLNKNLATSTEESEKKIKKSTSLSLDFVKIDPPIPMSVDTTPMSESTTSRLVLSVEKGEFESIPTTADTHITDEGFVFDGIPESGYIPIKRSFSDTLQKKVFSKRVTVEEASGLSTNCLKLFLHESISIPLATQTKLAENELLKYFIDNLHYFKHLNSLRDYFFLQDGEFGRNITENLFEKLYDVHFPIELINCRTLQNLVFGALQMSSKFQENSNYLSFKINSLPKRFHLGDPDVLDCLSLTYKVHWPLNILLPVDTVSKYDEVFKYLLKLNRISWVLKKIFLELKILAKVSGKKEIYLMMSPHYRRLHQCRHVMLHFIQTLQNYVVGEVLQSSWEIFERSLSTVNNLDSLYLAHTTYIKNILFLCLLNQKSTPLRKVIHKIFVVILKFYDHLRSRSWNCENGTYVHPNFSKLESIFQNFEEFVLYLFKIGRKVARSGYQPHLTQLLDMLDVNGYYSSKNDIHVT
ncbi:hypothetical protein Zmor_023880 [Zophobas morio]|uniref:Gamma-tubulin complex component 6 n=1 Tax=Zophobas morio TaxID=2755281 RepID=A0AA38HXN7_9CUCU|nr:hypothetical protein Zmor_023880 [Zophobas morio]